LFAFFAAQVTYPLPLFAQLGSPTIFSPRFWNPELNPPFAGMNRIPTSASLTSFAAQMT
jgi:hypothetical protein